MTRLIRANFSRLVKSRLFWLETFLMAATGALSVITMYREKLSTAGYDPDISALMFAGGIYMIMAGAVFIGLFVGTDYSDGTIRNKLIVGHGRNGVYFSNLIVCMAALLIMHLAYIAVSFGLGTLMIGPTEIPASLFFKVFLIGLAALAALCSVFLMISMVISSKASGCVAALIVAIVIFMTGMMIYSRLQESEYIEGYSMSYNETTGENEALQPERTENPRYITGTKREIYEFFNDFLPGGQMLQIASIEISHPARLPLYSGAIIIATTGCGIWIFRRKNIK